MLHEELELDHDYHPNILESTKKFSEIPETPATDADLGVREGASSRRCPAYGRQISGLGRSAAKAYLIHSLHAIDHVSLL